MFCWKLLWLENMLPVNAIRKKWNFLSFKTCSCSIFLDFLLKRTKQFMKGKILSTNERMDSSSTCSLWIFGRPVFDAMVSARYILWWLSLSTASTVGCSRSCCLQEVSTACAKWLSKYSYVNRLRAYDSQKFFL